MQQDDPFVTILHQWIEIMIQRSMQKFLHYARERGLSMSQFGVLFHLNRMPSCGVSDLGDHLGVTSAAASQLLDRLVQQGLIQRTEDPHDRRVKQIALTDEGRQVLDEGLQARQDWLEDLSQALTPDEKQQIGACLRTLIDKTSRVGGYQRTEI
jgi:DNA-binding MarR family transcriptional regulator